MFLWEQLMRTSVVVDDMILMARLRCATDHLDFTMATMSDLGWHLNLKKCFGGWYQV